MRVLAIDTSAEVCSVAIVEDGILIKSLKSNGEVEHSQTLMPMIKTILESLNITLDDIDLLACGTGPGSFTGIRIGIAAIKAFSDSKNIPVVGIKSLEALAYEVVIKKGRPNCKILSMIDAKNENVYFGAYKIFCGNFSTYKNPGIANIKEIVEYINFKQPVYIVGDYVQSKLEPFIKNRKDKEYAQGRDVLDHTYLKKDMPSLAEAVGIAAYDKYKKGIYGDSSTLRPMYLSAPQAERQRNGDQKKLYMLEMSKFDLENILKNYDQFPNSWDEKTLKEDYESSKYYIAKQGNEIVGFIGAREVISEMEIMNLVVRVDKRNLGIASSLLSHLIRQCSKINIKKMNLEVNETNKTAVNMYKNFGFQPVGRREKYYNHKDAAILMSM
jgi:ribosomal-protein-alanine acetyltransferase/universal bacterial protein YeaZ